MFFRQKIRSGIQEKFHAVLPPHCPGAGAAGIGRVIDVYSNADSAVFLFNPGGGGNDAVVTLKEEGGVVFYVGHFYFGF